MGTGVAGKIKVDTDDISEICEEMDTLIGAVDGAATKLDEAKYQSKSFANIPAASGGAFSATQSAVQEVGTAMAAASSFLTGYAEAVRNAVDIHTGSDQAAAGGSDAIKKDV